MKYFTLTEAAAYLGKSIRTLKYWLKSGKLIPEKTGATHTQFGPRLVQLFSEYQLRLVQLGEAISEKFEIEQFQSNISLQNIISPNDKLTKTLFSLPADEYYDAIQKGISIAVTEIISRGKKIQTHFKLNGGGFATLKRPLNEYDRVIFDVCNSAREEGFIGLTRDSLFRALIGGKTNQYPRPNQATAIVESLERLMTIIKIDFSQTRDKMPKYNSVPAQIISPILPCIILNNVLVNGQLTSLIKFTDESPLITIARAKKQIITSPVSLRDITNQNNTPLVIMIKSYVIRRVLEIVLHNMTPTITLADIFKHCELTNANRWQKQDARKTIIGVMENIKSEGMIKSFEFIKKGGTFYSISITF